VHDSDAPTAKRPPALDALVERITALDGWSTVCGPGRVDSRWHDDERRWAYFSITWDGTHPFDAAVVEVAQVDGVLYPMIFASSSLDAATRRAAHQLLRALSSGGGAANGPS